MVKDESMAPFMISAGAGFHDTVLFKRWWFGDNEINGRIIAIINPYKQGQILFRRVIATGNQWVQRMDDGGLIKIPSGHIWIECENPKNRKLDSLTDFGPISDKFVIGKATYIVWPIWKFQSVKELDKYKDLLQGYKHSRAYSNQEIYNKYGLI